jgi:hypothetical protein
MFFCNFVTTAITVLLLLYVCMLLFWKRLQDDNFNYAILIYPITRLSMPPLFSTTPLITENANNDKIVQHLRYHLLKPPTTTKQPHQKPGDEIVHHLRYHLLRPPPPPSPEEIWPFRHPTHFNAANYEDFDLDNFPRDEEDEQTTATTAAGTTADSPTSTAGAAFTKCFYNSSPIFLRFFYDYSPRAFSGFSALNPSQPQ